VHASTSGLVTGLDAGRQIGRTATTTVDHAAAVRRVPRAVSQTPDCLDEARCRRLTDEILTETGGVA
jgi:hypothetical protein